MSDEASVLKKTLSILKNRKGIYVIRMDNAPIGTPDIIACIDGCFVGIEVKDDVLGSYSLTLAQKMRGEQIMNAGGEFWLVDKTTVNALDAFLDKWFVERSGVGC